MMMMMMSLFMSVSTGRIEITLSCNVFANTALERGCSVYTVHGPFLRPAKTGINLDTPCLRAVFSGNASGARKHDPYVHG